MDGVTGNVISVLIGVVISFLLMLLKDFFETNRKVAIWRTIVFQELKTHRMMISDYRKFAEEKEGNVFYNNGVVFTDTIYNFELAQKALKEDFFIYSKYVKELQAFEMFVKQYKAATQNNQIDEIARMSSVDIIKKSI